MGGWWGALVWSDPRRNLSWGSSSSILSSSVQKVWSKKPISMLINLFIFIWGSRG